MKNYQAIHPYNLRGVQLDLARQYESVEYIKQFIDFIKVFDFNTLVLYLEGRVRTKSFQYKSGHYYNENEICSIVEYALKSGIEVIPVISVFGHAEHFFESPKMHHIAELRGGKVR